MGGRIVTCIHHIVVSYLHYKVRSLNPGVQAFLQKKKHRPISHSAGAAFSIGLPGFPEARMLKLNLASLRGAGWERHCVSGVLLQLPLREPLSR